MAVVQSLIGDNEANTIQGDVGADLIYGFDPQGPQAEVSSITATQVAEGLDEPVFVTAPEGDGSRLFVVEKGGEIRVLDLSSGELQSEPFLDASSEIATGGEQGLLGLAFHPSFAENGLFYVHMVNADRDSEIREYRVDSEGDQADPESARVILRVDQPDEYTNHKGGWLGFGPDGYLYTTLGDGGGAGDPLNSGQDMDSLLGKLLRIDVNGDDFPSDSARNYAIPSDNPFVGEDGADEIWALGLRNAWRASFDRGTGELYIADVGEKSWEEINIGSAGANYGWSVREGPSPFKDGDPSGGVLTDPIHFYGRDEGRSVTGGYVYRGESDGLQGQYVFADFGSGRIWTLQSGEDGWAAVERTDQVEVDTGSIDMPVSFGEDGRGNLYLVDYGGSVFRLNPETTSEDVGDDLRGGDGDDMIFGGAGNDLIAGDGGDDTLIGGLGADQFVIGPGSGTDMVSDFDFAGGDRIRLTGEPAYGVSERPGAALVTLPDDSSMLLAGVSPQDVTDDWFIFD